MSSTPNDPATSSEPKAENGGPAAPDHPPTRREPRAGSAAQPDTSGPSATPQDETTSQAPTEVASGSSNGPTSTRNMATDVPPKSGPPKALSEYVVTINRNTNIVVKIEKLVEGTGERKPLSQQDNATVSAQLASAARPLTTAMSAVGTQPVPTIPAMLDAPAFNALAMRAALTSPARVGGTPAQSLAQLARSLGSPSATNKQAEPQTATAVSAAPAVADPATLVQAYYQGVVDYLSTITGRR